MAKSKKIKKDKTIEAEKDFFLNDLVKAIYSSEDVYLNNFHKDLAVSTITMLFDKLQITDMMVGVDITNEEYKKYFKKLAIENGTDDYLYYKLFGDTDEKEK